MGLKIEHTFSDGIELKRCSACKEYKPLSCFGFMQRYRDGLNYQCRNCASVYNTKYRLNHYARVNESTSKAREKRRKKSSLFITKSKGRGCAICGYNICPEALEFHHVNGDKDRIIARLRDSNIEKIKIEMAKCIVICANCHRELHSVTLNKEKIR
jgi:hypothetical protein